MTTVTNISAVRYYSGETPGTAYSNPVTTVIRQSVPTPTSVRYFYRMSCCRSCNCCSCNCCSCNCCRCN